MITLCHVRSHISLSDGPRRVLEVCDKALKSAADARKEKSLASADDIEKAIRKLQNYGLKFHRT